MSELETVSKLDDYFTVGQAADYLGVSRSTLRNWDRDGRLKPYRHPVNSYRLYKRDDLQLLLKQIKEKKV